MGNFCAGLDSEWFSKFDICWTLYVGCLGEGGEGTGHLLDIMKMLADISYRFGHLC